jgi:hypothetical protein
MLEPKVTIVLPTPELAASLSSRLLALPGQQGISVDHDQGYFAVVRDEFPRTPTELERVLAIVGSWLADVELDAVTVESRWRVEHPRMAAESESRRPVLTWKFEEGPSAPEASPEDVGPAWLDRADGPGGIHSEQIADGEWITRDEARQLAEKHGYALSEDG